VELIGTYKVDAVYEINGEWMDGTATAQHYMNALQTEWPDDVFALSTDLTYYYIHRTDNPVEIVNSLGAKWSDSFDDYASGKIEASQIRCVFCQGIPCCCPPFGSEEYFAMCARLHENVPTDGNLPY
jgi:hypothetical protein